MQLGNESSATASRWPPYSSYYVIIYVITGHENFYVNDSSQNQGRAMGEVSLCLLRQDVSADMQYDLTGWFIRSGHLTWPKVKISYWAFGVKMHKFRCVFTRGIRWCFYLSKLKSYLQKRWFSPKATNFCLTCPRKVIIRPKVVKYGIVRFRRSVAKLYFN